jgi:hypothetical protein
VRDQQEIGSDFPRLKISPSFQITSPKDGKYNCVAFALGIETDKWWPISSPGTADHYWPLQNNDLSTPAFVSLFTEQGFVPCDSENHEAGHAKIAIYARNGRVKHVARQEADGTWRSKLGRGEDIQHDVGDLEGDLYGEIVCFMRRPRERPAGK